MEDYKEKYEQALERAKVINPGTADYEVAVKIFPELKSEDERIKKEIIECLKNNALGYPEQTRNKWFAWLEKQREMKPQGNSALEIWKDIRLEVYQQASGNRHEPNHSDDSTKMFSLTDIDEIFEKITEKQGEQNNKHLYDVIIALWDLLDKIDTFSDLQIDDTNPDNPFKKIEYIAQERHKFVKSDGYNLYIQGEQITDFKQDEQKPTDKVEPKFNVGDTIVEKDVDECDYETIKDIKNGRYIFTDGYCMDIDEQEGWQLVKTPAIIEQKSKDEPKFKVGDWVVSPNGVYWHIDAIRDSRYQVSSDLGSCADWPLNTNIYHKFTIQDAKDGDVLATDSDSICIFDGTVEDGKYPFAYCGLTGHYGFEVYDRKLPFTHNNDVHPATKEQRDLLFQKMEEAGYEWNAEKKELRKIEQKSTWSEEDEEMTKCVLISLEFFENLGKDVIGHPHPNYFKVKHKIYPDSVRNWLKSLKERMKGE